MSKRINTKITVPVMVIILIVLVILKANGMLTGFSGVSLGFVGNSTFHKYNGSYSKITGTFSHTLSPSKDSDGLHCKITTTSGSLHAVITEKESSKNLLDKEISGDEEFDISAEGKVIVRLTTEGHTGSYSFQY